MPDRDHAFRRRYIAWSVVIVTAVVAAAVWLAFTILKPTPPRFVTMATGPEGSVSAELG
jgi:TRAP-type uncharacterized transport system substrate-binding protein